MHYYSENPEQHEARYRELLEEYDGANDPVTSAACYVAAYPPFAVCVPQGKRGSNPLSWYWGPFDPVLDRRGESPVLDSLTDGQRFLLRAGIELYAGRHLHFDLAAAAEAWTEDEWRAFRQAVNIRRDRSS